MAEALVQVKTDLGADAVILHTRTFHTRSMLGLRKREMVEITAAKGVNVGHRRAAAARQAQASVGARAAAGPAAYASNARGDRGATALATLPAPAGAGRGAAGVPTPGVMDTHGFTGVALQAVIKEVGSLKTMVQDLVSEARQQKCPQIPEDLFVYYMQLIEHQVTAELAAEVIKTLQKSVRPEHLGQPEFVREKLCEQLEKLLPSSGPIVRSKSVGPHVVALVGPTGVGKTTTVAKLAANLQLRERHRVGLITLDTYRIAAVDQLKKYADIIRAPLRVVVSSDDMRDALRSMAECDFILIDTTGRSPNDAMKLGELKSLLEAAEPDEVHLVLSSTASEDCIQLAVSRFGDLDVDRIIFTKIDEAAHVGVVLNVVRKVNKRLSYITTGQDVPADIEVGRGRRLAQMILGAPV